MTLTIALVATLAGGGSATANWGSDREVAGGHSSTGEAAIAPLVITPLVELPNGCGDGWSGEGSID